MPHRTNNINNQSTTKRKSAQDKSTNKRVRHSNNCVQVCFSCDLSFTLRSSLADHHKLFHSDNLNSENGTALAQPKPYPCSQCSQRFGSRRALSYHTKARHTKLLPYSCPICSKCFVTNYQLKAHEITHKSKQERAEIFLCGECGKSLSSKAKLAQHILHLHSTQNQEQITENSQNTGGNDEENSGKNVSTRIKQFSCEECGKSFDYRHVLAKHRLIHERDSLAATEPSCEICHNTFRSQQTLQQHKLIHKGLHRAENVDNDNNPNNTQDSDKSARAYFCAECNREFSRQGNLQRHLRAQTCRKPLQSALPHFTHDLDPIVYTA
jgi:KRAB domain-containing zinc finger protein